MMLWIAQGTHCSKKELFQLKKFKIEGIACKIPFIKHHVMITEVFCAPNVVYLYGLQMSIVTYFSWTQ